MAVFKPIFDRVVIKRDESAAVDEVTKGGIHIPEMAGIDHRTGKPILADKLKFNTGIIVSVGDGVEHPLLVPGVTVYFGKHAGASIHPNRAIRKKQLAQGLTPTVEDEELFVCAEADIIGVLEDDDNDMTKENKVHE